MNSNELRAFAREVDPGLSLAWYGSYYVEVRLYSDVPGQQRTWTQEALIRDERDLLPWLNGFRRGKRRR